LSFFASSSTTAISLKNLAVELLPVQQLFDGLESAHLALVRFAKTGPKSATSIADLTAQIEVFTTQAQMLSDLVGSLRKIT